MFKYMLDTNIAIYVIKRRPVEVLEKFNINAARMVVSSITLAELIHGAEKSSFPEKNLKTVEDFISRLTVVTYDEKAAYHYGAIRASLEKKGTPIGINDLHIASHARSSGLIVITNNEKEFNRVDGLIVENWID
ncbi:type II toxin-antitoxin system tRNA(fMet)-specific endonuclease VapC [Photorhabdus viridis]|uniref:type II toxin-antitoxin system tRNA(fMet)-specific endonuclease VapC n=1 Tax=Photorhabdus viridis TaxID=3163327 RepID=UPI0033071945